MGQPKRWKEDKEDEKEKKWKTKGVRKREELPIEDGVTPMSRQNRWIYWYAPVLRPNQRLFSLLCLPYISSASLCFPLCQRSLLYPSYTAKGHFPLFPLPVPCLTPLARV